MTADIERRLRALEDEAEIQSLAARFSDAVNACDADAFARLWASEGAIWTIGPPLPSQAEGRGAIAAMLARLYQIERYFMQMTHSGVVTLDGHHATARFIIREHGRGDGTYYENLGIYNDEFVREADGWRFAKRSYVYRFLNRNPVDEIALEIAPSPVGPFPQKE